MSLSLIIPTYNGAHKIVNLLDSLKEQTLQPNEIIIVIDGSTDNTIEVLQTYKQFFTNLTIIEQENQGRACVRNNGAKIAKSDYYNYLICKPDIAHQLNLI